MSWRVQHASGRPSLHAHREEDEGLSSGEGEDLDNQTRSKFRGGLGSDRLGPSGTLQSRSFPAISSRGGASPAPPRIVPSFQVKARRKVLETLAKWEKAVEEDGRKKRRGVVGNDVNVLHHRAKYVRDTTPEYSTRIAKHPVPLLDPPAYECELPSIGGGGGGVRLYSPRSFDRPKRTPYVKPAVVPPPRLSTPEFRAAINFKLGPEAPLMWNTIKAAKKNYRDEWGGELRGQTRALAYRYMRYIHGSKDFSDETLREYMREQSELKAEREKGRKQHENVLAGVIREALETEEVAGIEFNRDFITEEQLKLIMLKAATSSDQRELFWLLLEEVVEEFLYNKDVVDCKRLVEAEVVQKYSDELYDLEPVLSTFTLRQLRAELKRYGKEESEFRAKLLALPSVESQAVRGLLRKRCLIEILLEQRKVHGVLGKGEVEEEEGDDDFFEDKEKVFIDPFVRKELVEALLEKHKTANELRGVMRTFKVDTKTPGVKGKERMIKMANNLVDTVSRKDDLFRAWKAVLLQGRHKIESDVTDDLLMMQKVVPGSRGLDSRGLGSRRRGSSRLKLRPRSGAWRPDGRWEDDFQRPGSEMSDWVKVKREDGGEEWRNRVTGEIIPIHMFFSPESEPGGFGVDYLETLLSRGVSLPLGDGGVGGGGDWGGWREAGFEPRPTTSQSDYDDDFEEYFRKRRLRMMERGVETKGSNVAYQRSLLEARRRYKKGVGVPMIGWARYVDDNGWPYFYNWNTGVSTYDNPFEYSDSDEDSDEEDAEKLRKELEARAFLEFCAIMVQARFRGQVERKRCREKMAKRFRKFKGDGERYLYEDLDNGNLLKKRPSIIKMLWPGSKF
ncbi:hypothetical protein TrRE_jg8631 [Triparma retinervis]|uniref:WW domain-containing protein n=1 Tax=Triparma retinervis TaxID=2557542 RepID=A0A9W7CFB9_9STRA|nr:hypothetical protein TrRE_jg8631 [Triparma retinervis]